MSRPLPHPIVTSGAPDDVVEPSIGVDGSLAERMGITERVVVRRLELVGFGADDAEQLSELAALVHRHGEEFVASFFDRLATFAEADALTLNRELLASARALKSQHLLAMVSGQYRLPYAEERLRLGEVYARAGLDPCVFVAAFHHMTSNIGFRVMEQSPRDSERAFRSYVAVKKITFFDLSLIVDALVYERERVIGVQQETIRQLSTPILRLRDRLLVLPIVGAMNSERETMMTEALLRAVRTHRANVVLLDVTGLPSVDAAQANHLMRSIESMRLMGARTILTGISAAIAEALVALPADLASVKTGGDLQTGLEIAERMLREPQPTMRDGLPARRLSASP